MALSALQELKLMALGRSPRDARRELREEETRLRAPTARKRRTTQAQYDAEAREVQLRGQARILAQLAAQQAADEAAARLKARRIAEQAAEDAARTKSSAVLNAVKLADATAARARDKARAQARQQARKQFKQERLTPLGIIEMGEKLDVKLKQFREKRGPLLRREFVDGCNEIYGTPLMVENLSYLKGTWPFVSHSSWSKENSDQRRFMAAENLRNRTEQRP
jgi:hypothetical protein